jgi:hypothetical protein
MKEAENVVGEGEYDVNSSIFGESVSYFSKLRVRSRRRKKRILGFFPFKFCLVRRFFGKNKTKQKKSIRIEFSFFVT